VEADWQEKREHRTLLPSPPGGTLILISLLAVARLPTSDRSRCCLDCLVPRCHAGSGTTPKAEDTLTRICAKSIHALMHIDISGGTEREMKSTAPQEGTSSKPTGSAPRSTTSVAFSHLNATNAELMTYSRLLTAEM